MIPSLQRTTQISALATEQPVEFFVGDHLLCGCLTKPAGAAGDLAAVFVHGWSGIRGGPNRLFVHVARALAEDGIPALRFDLRGRGESAGNGLETSLRTMAEDLEQAVEFMQSQTGCSRILLVGICSGANVAIGTLDRLASSAVSGLLLYSVYPFSDGDSFGRDVGRTWHFLRVYRHKLGCADTWRRLVRGDIDVRSVLRVLFGHFGASEKPAPETGQKSGGAAGKTAVATSKEGRFQSAPPTTALRKLTPDLPALLVYGTSDPDAKAARKYYESYAEEHNLPMRFEEVSGADHNFSSKSWQDSILALSRTFWREQQSLPLGASE
ncbi:MAG: alpha/beta hydrolase [Verrucomicrobiota bacterium]